MSINNIPNKIKQPAHCCIYCGKTYKLRTNVDKHIILCELINKPRKTVNNMEEICDDLPSQKKMYQMLLELGAKYNILEEKVNEINKYVIKKKKKINVLEWLNSNIVLECVFDKLHEKISINDDDIDYLLHNSFYETLNQLFSRNIYNCNLENEYPILAFTQKPNMFYVYNIVDNVKEWREISRDSLIKFLNKLHNKLFKYYYDWKKSHANRITDDDSFSITCDKALIKLMDIEFKQEAILNKIKSMMYSRLKKDMKALIEYEFEF